MQNIVIEACVESLDEVISAEQNGANRIELCSRLDLDGLSPAKELIKSTVDALRIPVKVMVRPRGGNYLYSDQEIEIMKEEILFCKNHKVKGIVIGIANGDGHLNIQEISRFASLAHPLKVTVHKAIDECIDPVFEVEQLLKINNVTAVLTSGKAKTAIEGKDLIKKMIRVTAGKITIIAAGKITKSNLTQVHGLIGACEYHGRNIV